MRFVLIIVGLILLLSTSGSAQIQVVIDTLSGTVCGEFIGFTSYQVISISNPVELQKSMSMTFQVYSPEGAPFECDQVVFYNGFDQAWGVYPFGSVNSEITPVTDGYEVTISASATFPADGLPISTDPIPCIGLKVSAYHTTPGAYICIDSTGEWEATTHESLPSSVTSSDEVCHVMGQEIPNCCFFDGWCSPGGPIQIYSARYVDLVEIHLHAVPWPGEGSMFAISSGPGEIERINIVESDYRYQPSVEDIGETIEVRIFPILDYCGDESYLYYATEDECIYEITIGDDDQALLRPYPEQDNVATTGEQLMVPLNVSDAGPAYDHVFDWYLDGPTPPTADMYLDPGVPAFYYTGQSADTGYHVVRVVLSEGGWADTVGFAIWHFEDFIPGDCNHDGDITIGDVSRLISGLFIGGLGPVPEASGDVNCVPGLSIGDVSRLVDHLFINKTELCDPRLVE